VRFSSHTCSHTHALFRSDSFFSSQRSGSGAATQLASADRQTLHAGMEGKKSRSLISIYRLLVELGYTDVVHVEGGMREWAGLGWPVEGEDIESWKAKAAAMP
jgi:hypothetical protein